MVNKHCREAVWLPHAGFLAVFHCTKKLWGLEVQCFCSQKYSWFVYKGTWRAKIEGFGDEPTSQKHVSSHSTC
eukprot:390612-Amphidinium_carterae.3